MVGILKRVLEEGNVALAILTSYIYLAGIKSKIGMVKKGLKRKG